MKKFIKHASILAISSFFIFSLSIIIKPVATSVFADDSVLSPAPTLSTDKADYNPGQTAVIFGSFFQSFQNIVLKIFGGSVADNTYTESAQNVTTDANGAFSTTYNLDNTYRPIYNVVASGADGTQLAQTAFTDAALNLNLDQCHNDTLASLSTLCGTAPTSWANGDVNGSNSQYREGDGLPYRFAIEKLDSGTWFVRVQYDFTKGGKFAIDRLTRYDLTQLSNPCQGVSGCTTASPIGSITIPGEVSSSSATAPALPNGGALDIAGTASALTVGDKTLTVWNYGTGTVTLGVADANVTQSGLSTGDSTREFKFSITTSGCPAQGCKIMIGWTGHISSSELAGNGGWGTGNGASNITGAPFHMRVLGVDATNGTTGGNQDRSVQLSAIVSPSTITIHKITSPAGGTGFGFTDTGGLSPASFSLNDGGTQTFSPAPGSYTVVETSPLPSYALTNLACTVTGTGTSATPNIGTRTASITIGSAGGGNVDCTYTNTLQQAHLTLVKTVINDNGGTSTVSSFPLFIDGSGVVSGVASTTSAGFHTASETTQAGYAASVWGGDCAPDGAITLLPGDNKTCTITNDDIQPKLHLRKVVVNDNGGTATVADFPLSAKGTVANDLSGTSPVDSTGTLQADTWALSETPLAGYTAGDWVCAGGIQNGSNITVGIGGEATCTITNNDISPRLIVIKHVINDDGDVAQASDFTMQVNGTNVSTPSFPGAENPGTTITLNAGNYSVNEALNNGYAKMLSADCAGAIAIGQTKTCTITNNDIPHATRTQGFWQTHTNYTSNVFSGFGGALVIGTHNVNSTSKLFAGFYSSIPKTTNGSQRTALDKARMQMLQQWLAAELNCKAFGCGIATQTLLANAASAWSGTNANLILSYASQLDAYNNSNDALPISGQGSATPKTSQSLAGASLSFWNILP